jgi:hypothetical protein
MLKEIQPKSCEKLTRYVNDLCRPNAEFLVLYIYRVSQEECARLREGVPYIKVYR